MEKSGVSQSIDTHLYKQTKAWRGREQLEAEQ